MSRFQMSHQSSTYVTYCGGEQTTYDTRKHARITFQTCRVPPTLTVLFGVHGTGYRPRFETNINFICDIGNFSSLTVTLPTPAAPEFSALFLLS